MSESHADEPARQADGRYTMVLGGLLLVIIVCLAVLWMAERRRRGHAEAALDQMTTRARQLEQVLGQELLGGGLGGGGAALRAADVVSRAPDEHGGAFHWRITAEAGERMGFSPGDTVTVLPAAASATAPATAPAGP